MKKSIVAIVVLIVLFASCSKATMQKCRISCLSSNGYITDVANVQMGLIEGDTIILEGYTGKVVILSIIKD